MARTSKAAKTTESVVPTPTPITDPTTTSDISSEKIIKSKKSKAPKQEVISAAPDVDVVDNVVADGDVVADADASPFAEKSIEFLAKLQQLSVLISALKTEHRTLEKMWARDLKIAQKQSSKRKRKAGNRAPSGFVKPTRISDELATFLEKPAGTEMARTEVTREINVYIRNHNLQDSKNGRKINPDTKLASLLKLKKTDELTYFNLQKYMSPHFAKAVKVEGGAAAVAPSATL